MTTNNTNPTKAPDAGDDELHRLLFSDEFWEKDYQVVGPHPEKLEQAIRAFYADKPQNQILDNPEMVSQTAVAGSDEAKPTATDTKNFRKLTNDYRPTLRHWATNLPEEEFDRILTEYGAKAFALGFRDINRLLKQQEEKLEQAIRTKYISRERIKTTIGEDEPTMGAQNEAGDVSLDDYESAARNGLRHDLRRELGLGGNKL